MSKEIDHFFILKDKKTKNRDLNRLFKDFDINKNFTLIETKSDQFSYNSKNIKINHNLNREDLFKRIKLSRIYNKYIVYKNHKLEFNTNEIEFLEKILEYERDILNEKDILIIAQLMRNILDDFSYEFGYINNEDVYDRVFSNFCIGK